MKSSLLSRGNAERGKVACGLGRVCDFGGRRMRADSPAMLGHAACRRTRFVRCAHCAQTAAASQITKRAARAATCPALLGASHARPAEPARAFAQRPVVHETRSRIGRARSMQMRVFGVVLSKDPSASHPDRPQRLGSAIDCSASHGADQ
jgi:hypothetical protein